MSRSNCCFLTCIQVSQEAGQVVWYSHLLENFPQFFVIHIVKGFGLVNKAEIDVFLELSCFFDDPMDIGNLISGSSAFFKTSLDIWMFSVHVLLKPGLENFEHYLTSMWDECNCVVVWAFFGIAFFQGLKWKLTFSSPVRIGWFTEVEEKTKSVPVGGDPVETLFKSQQVANTRFEKIIDYNPWFYCEWYVVCIRFLKIVLAGCQFVN